jgi:hypothetical protein
MTGVKANEDLVQLLSPKEFSTRSWGRRDRKGKVKGKRKGRRKGKRKGRRKGKRKGNGGERANERAYDRFLRIGQF